jgi:hypothetical protein
MYRAKYLHLYATDIRAMFERGVATSSNKLGAGRMLEVLRRDYPGRFNLPTESEIRTEISRLFGASKNKKAGHDQQDDIGERTKFRIPTEIAEHLLL